ncbi:MAG: hypothetical protein HY815_06640 [Candidatus Riflebacteria bacterium]|nr:hypothetical protein [Candidatus Riflebacteria bacterium]
MRIQTGLDAMHIDRLDGWIDQAHVDRMAAEWHDQRSKILMDSRTHLAVNQTGQSASSVRRSTAPRGLEALRSHPEEVPG